MGYPPTLRSRASACEVVSSFHVFPSCLSSVLAIRGGSGMGVGHPRNVEGGSPPPIQASARSLHRALEPTLERYGA